MELNFKNLEEYLQAYMDNESQEEITIDSDSDGNQETYQYKSLASDLNSVSPAQRLGFIEKYMEFIAPKQLRRGTTSASEDKDFNLVEAK